MAMRTRPASAADSSSWVIAARVLPLPVVAASGDPRSSAFPRWGRSRTRSRGSPGAHLGVRRRSAPLAAAGEPLRPAGVRRVQTLVDDRCALGCVVGGLGVDASAARQSTPSTAAGAGAAIRPVPPDPALPSGRSVHARPARPRTPHVVDPRSRPCSRDRRESDLATLGLRSSASNSGKVAEASKGGSKQNYTGGDAGGGDQRRA